MENQPDTLSCSIVKVFCILQSLLKYTVYTQVIILIVESGLLSIYTFGTFKSHIYPGCAMCSYVKMSFFCSKFLVKFVVLYATE
jgi:hypothetical protein